MVGREEFPALTNGNGARQHINSEAGDTSSTTDIMDARCLFIILGIEWNVLETTQKLSNAQELGLFPDSRQDLLTCDAEQAKSKPGMVSPPRFNVSNFELTS